MIDSFLMTGNIPNKKESDQNCVSMTTDKQVYLSLEHAYHQFIVYNLCLSMTH